MPRHPSKRSSTPRLPMPSATGQEQSKQAAMKDEVQQQTKDILTAVNLKALQKLKAQAKHEKESRGDDMGKRMWRREENGGSNDILTEENLRFFKELKIQAREGRRRG
ncbi:hypothetical protein FALCPG4_016211 [Fusarium falciforme]